MSKIEKSIEVGVPASAAYSQWTRFDELPRFMEGVESVYQVDDRRLRWRVEICGETIEWEAEITEQIPDKRIAWTSTEGARISSVVTFHRLSGECSLVILQLDYEPKDAVENVGDWLGVASRRVEGDLERFKQFIESRGRETRAHPGSIPSPDERRSRM